MSRSRIETWLVVERGARSAAEGHLQVNVPPAGAWPGAPGELLQGTVTSFADACASLDAALTAAEPALAWTVTPGLDYCTISTVGGVDAFDLRFMDSEISDYFGFAAAEYLNVTSITSTRPAGRITMQHPVVPEWWDEISRDVATGHRGSSAGVAFARREGQRIAVPVASTEMEHFVGVLMRLRHGIPGRVWIDYTAAAAWAWTAAGWTGGRPLALYDPSATVDLSRWLTAPWIGLRSVELDLVEVAV